MTESTPDKPRSDWAFRALFARVFVGGLFVIAAIGKIIAPEDFAKEVRAYQMLPVGATNAVAYVLPWLELFAGLLLVCCLWRREARLIIAVMLAVFTIAKSVTYAQGLQIDCGCGGQIPVLKLIFNSPQGIVTNLVLLGLLGVDWLAERRRRASRALDTPVTQTAPACEE